MNRSSSQSKAVDAVADLGRKSEERGSLLRCRARVAGSPLGMALPVEETMGLLTLERCLCRGTPAAASPARRGQCASRPDGSGESVGPWLQRMASCRLKQRCGH